MRVLGFDPGVNNFAYCLLNDREPVESGLLAYPMQTPDDDHRFLNEIIELFRRLQPDLILGERYTFRGPQSVHAELVNLMLGRLCVVAELTLGLPVPLIQAAQWKNFFKVKQLPKVKGIKKGTWGIWPHHQKFFKVIHEVDAACIALYAFLKHTGQPYLLTEAFADVG